MTSTASSFLALIAVLVFGALGFGWRILVHRRRTGDSGFRGFTGQRGSAGWLGGVLLVLGSLAVAAAPILALTGAVATVDAFSGSAWRALGLVLYLAGLAGTLWSQEAMGRSWRIGVDPGERTALVTAGPFRLVRNPIYTAMLAALAGIALLSPSLASAGAFLLVVVAIELHVRAVEEPHLVRSHGAAYLGWASRTGRFLPGIGRLRPPTTVPAAG